MLEHLCNNMSLDAQKQVSDVSTTVPFQWDASADAGSNAKRLRDYLDEAKIDRYVTRRGKRPNGLSSLPLVFHLWLLGLIDTPVFKRAACVAGVEAEVATMGEAEREARRERIEAEAAQQAGFDAANGVKAEDAEMATGEDAVDGAGEELDAMVAALEHGHRMEGGAVDGAAVPPAAPDANTVVDSQAQALAPAAVPAPPPAADAVPAPPAALPAAPAAQTPPAAQPPPSTQLAPAPPLQTHMDPPSSTSILQQVAASLSPAKPVAAPQPAAPLAAVPQTTAPAVGQSAPAAVATAAPKEGAAEAPPAQAASAAPPGAGAAQ